MVTTSCECNADFGNVIDSVRDALAKAGIELDESCCMGGEGEGPRVKVVCVAPGLKDTVEDVGRSSRDQVVMVRVDGQTSESLDAWVEAGAVKSRSEAAAVFIREGLKLRQTELAQLKDALRDVQDAKERLKAKACELFCSDECDC